TFNCLEPSLAAPLAAAHDAGLGVIVKEALANGRLTPANTRPEDASLVRALGDTAGRLGCGIDQLALAFVLAQPFVDVVLSGAGGGAAPGSRSSLHARSVGRRVPPPAAGARGSCGGRRSRRPRRRRPQRIVLSDPARGGDAPAATPAASARACGGRGDVAIY